MKIIGLTGGIGSGKSTVGRAFGLLGIAVFDSDKNAHNVYYQPGIKKQVITLLGENVYLNELAINKPLIASLVFSDTEKLTALNAIIHPAVKELFTNWLKKQEGDYVIKESALLFETALDKQCDRIIQVSAPEKLRIQRATLRDKSTSEQIKQRISKQWTDEEKEKLADFVVINNDQLLLLPQVLAIHQELCCLKN